MNRSAVGSVLALASAALLGFFACSDGESGEVETAAERGAKVYKNVCVACHNADPSQQGSLGPPIAGSPRELVEARVVHGTYPDGYQPKLPGSVMPKFPHLAVAVDDLTAFLGGDPP